MALSSIFESSNGEKRWIEQIHKILAEEVKIQIEPVSIFRVPSTLSIYKPEAYVPQVVGIGPYHHFRPELYEMERYKLIAANTLQKQFKSLEFEQLVNELTLLEQRIRPCYHKYLDIEGETLAWIMAIDGLFLLDFLRRYNLSPSTLAAHLLDSTGRKLAHGSVLGDILMLENQIPIFVLSKILSIQCSSQADEANGILRSEVMDFCKAVSPLKIKEDPTLFQEEPIPAHLLDLLYQLIGSKFNEPVELANTNDDAEATIMDEAMGSDSSKFFEVFGKLWPMICNLNVGLISNITNPIKSVVSVGTNIFSSVHGVSDILVSENNETDKLPKIEEIHIPSVTDLSKAGVEFCPSTGGIQTIDFNPQTRIFTLPVITLDVDSEVVMRNLVAYEASIESESLVFTRYTELMTGIVDTDKDAKLLKKKNIIVSRLKTDDDVANLFNGMSKAVRHTHVPHIDKTIKEVNAYYYATSLVREYRRLKNFACGSWKILTILAVVLLMLLMALQSFCSVYVCSDFFHTTARS